YFKIEPDPGDLTSSIHLEIRKNVSTTNMNIPFEDAQSPLFAYVVWIFLAFLTYLVVPPYLLSRGNEDTIFDPDISVYHSFMPSVSHRSGDFIFHLLPHGPMNSGPSRACGSVNKNKALRGWQPMLILVVDCSDFEASRACGFCPSFTRASNPQLHFRNPIS
ncbi:hypothetical protein Tco_1222646, partial [Tanacetum coccineum]